MRDSLTTLPAEKSAATSSDKTARTGRVSYTATITPRALPSDTLPPPPAVAPGPTPEDMEKAARAKLRRRLRIRFEFVLGVGALLALGFILIPKKWVHHYVPPLTAGEAAADSDDEDFAPSAQGDNTAAAGAKNAAEWVELSSISGVRKTRMMINGKVRKLNEPIPPFRVSWTGTDSGQLLFRGPDGAEYHRHATR